MAWINDILDELSSLRTWGYGIGTTCATEPTALAALALLAHDRQDAAERALKWLADHQTKDGTLGVTASQSSPHWPTYLAVLAWLAADRLRFADNIQRASLKLLSLQGETLGQSEAMGHDTTLLGWPWVEGTHSWIEPTAMAVMALKGIGKENHPRAKEGVSLLIDRILPQGGCNYGNTKVLGQYLRPHVQPTGICLLALAGESDTRGSIARSIAYLKRELSSETPSVSLSWALLGMGAHIRLPDGFTEWIKAAAKRVQCRGRSPHKLALLALASKAEARPLTEFQAKALAL